MAFDLNCIGILREKPNQKFEFLVRWFIDEIKEDSKDTYLPNPEGKFYLTVRTRNSKEYIKADGTVDKIPVGGLLELPEITPLNYLMIAPPKSGVPEKPVDFNSNPENDEKAGIGIYHILADSNHSKYSRLMKDKTHRALSINGHLKSNVLFSEISVNTFADNLIDYIIFHQIKPRELQAIFVKEFQKIEKSSFVNSFTSQFDDLPSLFTFHLIENYKLKKALNESELKNVLRSAWNNAFVLSQLLKDITFLKEINDLKEKRENLKAQLSILIGQGVDIIDYWCNPLISQSNRVENDCGKQYPLAEALGLGTTIGHIDKTVIKNWRDSGDEILISVEYVPPTKASLLKSKVYDWKNLHDESLLEELPNLKSQLNIITNKGSNSLENVFNFKTSCMPDKPKSSEIEYDLNLKRIKTEFENDQDLEDKIKYSENLEISTGDGRVTFKTTKPDEKYFPVVRPDGTITEEKSSIITGVNIYSIWEPESSSSLLSKYFIDPNTNPTLDELKPWLVSRRYSFSKDIKPYFLASNQNINKLQSNPPKSPSFQKASEISNTEKIINVTDDGRVLYELMPKAKSEDGNGNICIYHLNIREGLKNEFIPELPLTWDKFPIETDWQPNKWRNGLSKNKPQGYRFWATSVDVFGQESEPIPIISKETSNSAPTKLFYFKFRSCLQPAPSNTTEKQDFITSGFDETTNRIKVKWESPFIGSLGNSVEIQQTKPPLVDLSKKERIKKSNIVANVLYIRKPHNSESRDIPDNDLDNFINGFIASLPTQLNNDKWKIGLKEIFKHNSNWSSFKSFVNLSNNNPNEVWEHKLILQNIDKGFDYKILINFEIVDTEKQFWLNSDDKRNLYIVEQLDSNVNSAYEYYQVKEIQETPSISNLAFTDSLHVANKFAPRQLSIQQENFNFAKPILGIQGINRDLVLSNILTTPSIINEVEIDGKLEKAVVFETNEQDILCTHSQNIMLDSALYRCNVNPKFNLTDTKNILRNEFSNLNKKIFAEKSKSSEERYFIFTSESNKNIISNDLIGFRGLKHFKIRYNSIFSNFQSFKEESEATKFHIFQTRLRLNNNFDFSVSFRAVNFKISNNSKFEKVKFEPLVKPEEYNVPITIAIKYTTGYVLAKIKPIETPVSKVSNEYVVEILEILYKERETSGSPISLSFILSNQILEKEIKISENLIYEEDLFIPVGGGSKELIIWSIMTSSSLGIFSKNIESKCQIFQSSILPPTPNNVFVAQINTVEEKEKYKLDSRLHKKWLPNELQNLNDNLQRFPRNFIKWDIEDSLTDDIYLAIEREFRDEDSNRLKLLSEFKNDWELALKIEKLALIDDKNPHGLLLLAWLSNTSNSSLYNWLFESSEIKIPGEMASQINIGKFFVGPESKLSDPKLPLLSGLIPDGLSPSKVMFIDYFYDNVKLFDAMDTFRSYNYRLSSYIDIDPGDKFGIDSKQKYLYSKPSEWSGWVRPTYPEIKIVEVLPQREVPNDLLTPQVEFNFILNEISLLKSQNFVPKKLFYQIIIKREIRNSISTLIDNPNRTSYIEVGEMLRIPTKPSQNIPYRITDNNLERENIQSEMILNYKVEVSVIAIDSSDKTFVLRKEVVKRFDKIKISPIKQDKELKKILIVKIE